MQTRMETELQRDEARGGEDGLRKRDGGVKTWTGTRTDRWTRVPSSTPSGDGFLHLS